MDNTTQSHEGANFRLMARLAYFSASASTIAVLGMIGIFLVYGIGQDPLQFFHVPADYNAILLRNPEVLRATLGADNAFIIFYTLMFLALGTVLQTALVPRNLIYFGMGLMILTGFFDLIENMHFLSMLAMSQAGNAPGAAEIELQVWESLLKFHVSYLGLFIFGVALPSTDRLMRSLRFLLIFVQWPVGMLIYLTPVAIAKPLLFARFGLFVIALVLIAMICRRYATGSDVPG